MSPPVAADLASERTQLAWTRTALAVAVNGALLCKFAHRTHPAALTYAAGGVLIVLAAVLWIRAEKAYGHRNTSLRAGVSPTRPRDVRIAWAAAVGSTSLVLAIAIGWLLR